MMSDFYDIGDYCPIVVFNQYEDKNFNSYINCKSLYPIDKHETVFEEGLAYDEDDGFNDIYRAHKHQRMKDGGLWGTKRHSCVTFLQKPALDRGTMKEVWIWI